MKCARCGFHSPDGFAFCGKCGAPLTRACAQCGFANPPEMAFCGKCGASLGAPAAELTPADLDHLRRYLPVSLIEALQYDLPAPSPRLLEECQGQVGTDWAQAFARRGAGGFIGNTGFGYGDSDLVAYSEKAMVYFTQALNDWSEGPQTVGRALMRAKQRYFNTASAGSFSNYDEKILSEMTLYGLPMLGVTMPVTSTTPPGGDEPLAAEAAARPDVFAQNVSVTGVSLNFSYAPPATTQFGTFYRLTGDAQADEQVAAGRPIQPRTSLNIHLTNTTTIAHGVVMVGGTFTEVPNFDPAISRVLTDDLYAQTEPLFPAAEWYPHALGSINRFLRIDAQLRERLVVVPGQFRATGTGAQGQTIGTERLYTSLQFEVYHAPFAELDFIAPSIWQVEADNSPSGVQFRVLVTDDSGSVARVVVLYRTLANNSWTKVELAYSPTTGVATANLPPTGELVEYFVQAVDPTGNVSIALDHGNPFQQALGPAKLYLPLIRR